MVKGDKVKEKSFKKIGFGLFKLKGFNPETNEEVEQMGGWVKEGSKAPVYVDTAKDKDTGEEHERVRLDFYLEEANTGLKYKEAFFLENTPSLSQKKEDEPRKKEFINTTGRTMWVYNDLELTENFAATDYHHAIKGESLLMDFLKKLMNLDWKAEISYDFKKMFNGHFKELADDLANAESIIIPMVIKQQPNAENPDEIMEYQESFRGYARGNEYKFVNLKGIEGWSEQDIEDIRRKDSSNKNLFDDRKRGDRLNEKAKWINDVDRIVLKMTDKEHGCRHIYFLGKLKEYDGNALPSTGKVVDETNVSW